MNSAQKIIDQVLTRAFPGTSEAAKLLYRAEVASWINQALTALPREAVDRYLLDRQDTSFRSYLRTVALRLGLRDHVLSWSEQQMWSASRGWGWSAQGSSTPIVSVTRSETESAIVGAMQSMIAANELLAAPVVADGQESQPIANNYIEFVWGDQYAPVALSLFRANVIPTSNHEDRNSLLTLLVESNQHLSVYSEGDNLVDPDDTILMSVGTRIRAEFASDGAISIVLYTDADVELARYPVYRWFPGMMGDGVTLTCDATTQNPTNARMIALALAGAVSAPVLVDWQASRASGDELVIAPSSKARIGHYLLASLAFEQKHYVEATNNVGDLWPTIEGRWTQGGDFATENITVTVLNQTQFQWSSASNPAATLSFSTIAQPLGATGLSIVWNKPKANADELNTYFVQPFRLTPGSGWTQHAISSAVGNFIEVVYGRFITAQDRQYKFFTSEEVEIRTQVSLYSGVDGLAPIAATASGVTVAATTHAVSFLSAPSATQAIALFFANPDNERFNHNLVDIAPLRITESVVPVLQFGADDATVKNVRIGNLDTLSAAMPRDFDLILDTVLKVGSVVFEGGKPLSWLGDQPVAFLPRIANLWRWTIENNQFQISCNNSKAPPSSRVLVTGCAVLKPEELSPGEVERLIERLVVIAQERAKNRK